jgi:hypothetical protein
MRLRILTVAVSYELYPLLQSPLARSIRYCNRILARLVDIDEGAMDEEELAFRLTSHS